MDEWILSWLYQRTHSAVSRSTSRGSPQFLPSVAGVMHSVLYSPIVDSMSALSSASPTVPIDPAIPASASCSVNARAVYWASSTGRCNTGLVKRAYLLREDLSGSLPPEVLAGSVVERVSDGFKVLGGPARQVCALGEVLPQQA